MKEINSKSAVYHNITFAHEFLAERCELYMHVANKQANCFVCF